MIVPHIKDIVIVTSTVDGKRLALLKAAHLDPDANYHTMSSYEIETKARSLHVIGVVLDARKWEDLTDAGRKTLEAAGAKYVKARGLKTIKDLLTFVR